MVNFHSSPNITNNDVSRVSAALGFDLIGFSDYDELSEETERLQTWLKNGYNAGMKYMEKNIDKKKDVRLILPEAKSIISLGMNYFTPHQFAGQENSGKVSRYAWGKDYHLIIWEKLDQLKTILKKIDPSFEAITYVDTGPVMDKAWAVRSGLGWLGKNSNVINRKIGSWFFIATVITNYKLSPSKNAADLCGSCTACADACPTKAIAEDYVVDSNKCISYLTIENKGEIDETFAGKFENWIFGCDICQDVCPWNKKFSLPTSQQAFNSRDEDREISFQEIDEMSEDFFKHKFAESPILRTKLKGLKRNAEFLKKKKSESSYGMCNQTIKKK